MNTEIFVPLGPTSKDYMIRSGDRRNARWFHFSVKDGEQDMAEISFAEADELLNRAYPFREPEYYKERGPESMSGEIEV